MLPDKDMKKGLLIVNTGKGKGKTTAAMGIALRAIGHGYRVCVIQFIKGSRLSGEKSAAVRLGDLIDFHVMGRGFIRRSKDQEKDRQAAREAWEFAKDIMSIGKYRMVILDELTYLIKYGIIEEREVLDVLSGRRKDLHVVVTGRYASPSLIEAADLVTEMKEIKHPLRSGVKAQRGIEF